MNLIARLSLALALSLFAAAASAQLGGGLDIGFDTKPGANAAAPGAAFPIAVEVRLGAGLHVNSNAPLESYLIPTVLTFEPPDGITVARIAYPEAILLKTGGSTTELSVYEKTFYVAAELAIDSALAPGDYTVPGKLRYQACDDQQCFAPKNQDVTFTLTVVDPSSTITPQNESIFASLNWQSTVADETAGEGEASAEPQLLTDGPEVLTQLDAFTVAATAGGFLEPDEFIAFIDAAETGVAQTGILENQGPIAMIALILIGGMALNLTPCVLPLIPINLAIIGAGAKAGSRSRGFVLGASYGLGMTVAYGALGLIVILTAGTFGAINSTLWFNAAIAILFVVLGLAMFDVITIDFSRFQSKLAPNASKKGSIPFAFGMGAVAALLAGACVAPVVIQVIVFASDLYSKGTTIALALPFVLGLGMALPWPIAGAGMSLMPKPGAWMVRVKQAMGLFILGFAAYYAFLAWEIYDQRNVDEAEVRASAEKLREEGWTPSLSQGLAAAKAENKPVLVDMWATWCKNCLVMDKTTLVDPAVTARLENYIKVKYQAEDLDATPAKELLKRFGGIGLPQYAILRPNASPETP